MDNAELYVTTDAFQRSLAVKVLKEFSSQLSWTDEEIVLDVGCGPGDISAEILLPQLPKGSSLIGVDISSKMIKFANDNYSNENVRFCTLDFAVKNITRYFPEHYFTKLFSFNCLHWIKDQQQVARNLFTLLRPGGELVSILIPVSEMYDAFRHISDREQFKQYCKNAERAIPTLHYSCEDLKRRLTAQGFDVTTCEWRRTPFIYPSLEVVSTSFEAIDPFVKWMPENVKLKYLEAFKQFVREPSDVQHLLPSGEVRIMHRSIVLYARRPK